MTRIRLTNIPLQRQFHYAPDNASQKLIDGPPKSAKRRMTSSGSMLPLGRLI
jgi:hypothetical protein